MGAFSLHLKIKHLMVKNALLLRRNPHPIIFMIILVIILIPLTSVYQNIENWDIKVGVVNEDRGYNGICYSSFLLSELNMNEIQYSSMKNAERAGAQGSVDAVIHIHKNFSEVIYQLIQGNLTMLRNMTIIDIYIFSHYPQVKAALAAKIKAFYEKFALEGYKEIISYQQMSSYSAFSYYSASMLIAFIFTYYYTLLFLYKDYHGPFFWMYFKRRDGFAGLILTNLLFFYSISAFISLILLVVYNLPFSLIYSLIPLFIIVLGSVSLAFFTSTFVKKEYHIYYISPIFVLLGIIASGIIGPEKYMPLYLQVIYEMYPISIEFFFSSIYHIVRALGISAVLIAYSGWYYLRRR